MTGTTPVSTVQLDFHPAIRGNAVTPLLRPARPAIPILLACFCLSAHAQPGQWTWVGGSNKVAQAGVYGTLGTPDAKNIPGARYGAATWTEKNGAVWLFGGLGYDADGDLGGYTGHGELNDFWEFDPTTNQWTWMGGSSTYDTYGGYAGVYGVQGTPDPANFPGSRGAAATWTDPSGNFWLFGGTGYGANARLGSGYLSDLWKFDPSTKEWTWVSGSTTVGQPGVYGTIGTPDQGDFPGSRNFASAWTDSDGHLWLFGGNGIDADGYGGWLNDLWEFDPSTTEWTWIGGSNTLTLQHGGYGEPGVYGDLGKASSENTPGGRYAATSWIDATGKLWLFGGLGFDSVGTLAFLDDVWEFDPSMSQWAWMGGSSTVSCLYCSQPAVYGIEGLFAAGNTPGGRYASTALAANGNFWLLGGNRYAAGSGSTQLYLNDLWEFKPATNQWSWMSGNNSPGSKNGQPGVYGKLGMAAAGNSPGGRAPSTGWTDTNGALWLFGGYGVDSAGNLGYLNDVWKFQLLAAKPVFSIKAGKYKSAQSVAITDATPNATIYYTVDGSTPTTNSNKYTVPLTIVNTTTVKAIAAATGFANSAAASALYTILKPQTIAFTLLTSPVTYGVTPIALSANASSGLAVAFSVTGPARVTGSILSVTGAGTVIVSAIQAGNATYAAAQASQTVTVHKAVLTVEAANRSMTYGGGVPRLSYKITGFVNGDLQVHAVSGAPVLFTAVTSKSPAGSYPITIAAGTLGAKNYSFEFAPGTLTINKAGLTVKANNLSMKQGAAVPALT
jgi:N-acetylneuraminic acid mutarotase